MTCPNCSKPVTEADQECLNCGFILSKWRAAQAGQASGAVSGGGGGSTTVLPRQSAGEDSSAGVKLETLLLFGLFLSVALYYFVFKPRAGGEGAVSRGKCAVSGEVLDIYKLQPVSGVRLVFGPRSQAMTDGFGKYIATLSPGATHQALLSHGQYKPAPIEGFGRDWREATFEQRVRAARVAEALAAAPSGAPAGAELKCTAGEEQVFNFALVPLSVGTDEKALIDAVQ